MLPPPPGATLFPYTTLFRSEQSRYREINAKKTLNRGQHRCRCKRIAAKSKKIARCFEDRKSTRLNSSHRTISYAVFCLKKKKASRRLAPPTPTSPPQRHSRQ